MVLSDIPVPEIYKESSDFRFFIKWIEACLGQIQTDTNNLIDLLDPLRCPSKLLWMLGDTCGYKYDERASVAFNRLVLLYFAKLIRYRGSYMGMMLATHINLDQFNLADYAEENPVLEDRLENTSIPVNAVSVTPHADKGYIDVVYYSENIPTDICTEYVRPVGMYCFQHAGVALNARTKISVDARLTNMKDTKMPFGPSFVAHYRRSDYARLQRYLATGDASQTGNEEELEERRKVYYRNMDYEQKTHATNNINPGYRSLFSLQISNNEHIVKALLPSAKEPDSIFSIGYGPQNVDVTYPDNYLKHEDNPVYNLRLDKNLEESFTPQVYTVEADRGVVASKPQVNPVMATMGDAISMSADNRKYTKYHKSTGQIDVVSSGQNNGN